MSGYYFDYLEKLGASVVHVVDLDVERTKELGKRFGAKCSTDYKELIKNPDVSVVVVLAHAKYHKEICMAAIAAGKDVICEKTLSNSGEEAAEIAKAALQNDVIFFTAYMKRFFPALQKAKELIPSLGIIFSAYARSYQFWGNLYEVAEDFSGDLWLSRYGGGVLKCAGSHIVDLVLYLLGKPETTYANIDYVGNPKLDRKAVALLEYGQGKVVVFEAAGHPLSKIGFQKNNWDERLEINGTKGRLDIFTTTWNKPEECAALLVHYDEATQTSTEYRFEAINTFHAQVGYFHDCLSKRKQGSPSSVDGFYVDAVMSAMVQSSKEKRVITIDWKGL
jgi:predicted dehydrogenase